MSSSSLAAADSCKYRKRTTPATPAPCPGWKVCRRGSDAVFIFRKRTRGAWRGEWRWSKLVASCNLNRVQEERGHTTDPHSQQSGRGETGREMYLDFWKEPGSWSLLWEHWPTAIVVSKDGILKPKSAGDSGYPVFSGTPSTRGSSTPAMWDEASLYKSTHPVTHLWNAARGEGLLEISKGRLRKKGPLLWVQNDVSLQGPEA